MMKGRNENLLDSFILLFRSRKEIIFAVTWSAALSSIIAGKGFPPVYESFTAIIASMMIVTSVYVYNDVIDKEMDAYSSQEKKKTRPIANGKVSVKHAMFFVYLTGIIGLSACFLLNSYAIIIGFTYYIMVFFYSYPKIRFKTMTIMKNLVTSLLIPTAFMISGVAIEQKISGEIALISSTYYILTVFLQPAIADMLDYREDLAFNVKTIGNSLSWKQNIVLYNIGVGSMILSSILSYTIFGFHYVVPIVTSVLCSYLILYSYMLRNENGERASYKLRPVSYMLLLSIPLLFAIGAII